MSTTQLETQILNIFHSSGLNKTEIRGVLESLNEQFQESNQGDFFQELKSEIESNTSSSSTKWFTSEEVDSYL
ncbi:MAG: hypothetical protein ACRCXZ_01360 [Patescibacteria group bacterium]